MRSTIRVDFKGLDTNGMVSPYPMKPGFEPVIRVNLQQSEDVRDSLMKSFFTHTEFIKVQYLDFDDGNTNANIMLTPISYEEIEESREKPVATNTLPSAFQIGDIVQYSIIAGGTPTETSFISGEGKIVGVNFTEASVFYTVLDLIKNTIHKNVPSSLVVANMLP